MFIALQKEALVDIDLNVQASVCLFIIITSLDDLVASHGRLVNLGDVLVLSRVQELFEIKLVCLRHLWGLLEVLTIWGEVRVLGDDAHILLSFVTLIRVGVLQLGRLHLGFGHVTTLTDWKISTRLAHIR